MAVNIPLAIEYVKQISDSLALARLEFLLTETPPSNDVIHQFESNQRLDGGWSPFWISNYSSVDATCFRLAKAHQLGLNTAVSSIAKAVDFLLNRQQLDGKWEEEPSVAKVAPPWASPGDLASQLYLTANCGYWIALLSPIQPSKDKATNFLLKHLGEHGRFPSYLHTHWLTAGLCYATGNRHHAEKIISYLENKQNEFSANNLTWLTVCLLAAKMPAHHPFLQRAINRLAQLQKPDGRWQSDDQMEEDVHVTLEALRALKLSGYFFN